MTVLTRAGAGLRARRPSARAARRSEGYLVLEAALAIPVYVFFVLAVMQIVVFATAQSTVTTAVNTTAVELSQHSYIRSTEVGQDVQHAANLLDQLVSGLSGKAAGLDPDNPVLQTTLNPGKAADEMLRKHLEGSDKGLRTMGVVDGAEGVRATSETNLFDGDKLVLDVEYELSVPWMFDRTITMHAHAETHRWEADR